MTKSDKIFIKKLVKQILKNNYWIAIDNGGDCLEELQGKTHPKNNRMSNDFDTIIKNLGHTDEDYIFLCARDEERKKFIRIGSFYAIYNNGFGINDMEGVIADYSSSNVCESIMKSAIQS